MTASQTLMTPERDIPAAPETPGTSTSAWKLVAGREIRLRLRSKAFWISTATLLLVVVAGAVLLRVLPKSAPSYTVAIGDDRSANIVAGAGPAATQLAGGDSAAAAKVTAQRVASPSAAQALAKDGSVDAALIAPAEANGPWRLIAKSQPDQALAAIVSASVRSQVVTANAAAAGVDLAALQAGTTVVPVALDGSVDHATIQFAVSFAFGFLFFLSTQLFGSTTGSSIVEEKESRVVEVLLSAIPTRQLLVGKVLGNVAVGLAQMGLVIATVLGAATWTGSVPYLGDIIRASGLFFVYYIIGFVTVCFLFGGFASLASRNQDLQSATAPLQLLITAAYMLSFVPSQGITAVASYIPVLSTVTMPSRAFAGTTTIGQVAVSLVLALAALVGSLIVADTAYQHSVLQLGKRIGIGTVFGRVPKPEVEPHHTQAVYPSTVGLTKGA
jgi:ABC-2 type transport system permease protein